MAAESVKEAAKRDKLVAEQVKELSHVEQEINAKADARIKAAEREWLGQLEAAASAQEEELEAKFRDHAHKQAVADAAARQANEAAAMHMEDLIAHAVRDADRLIQKLRNKLRDAEAAAADAAKEVQREKDKWSASTKSIVDALNDEWRAKQRQWKGQLAEERAQAESKRRGAVDALMGEMDGMREQLEKNNSRTTQDAVEAAR